MERSARARQLSQYWPWLPAFRVVAETEHLPTAARRLHVSPSALSRTIRLLEDALERPLFERSGRRLVLNDAGRGFLDAVRDAMRLVDEGHAAVADARFLGPIRIAVSAPLAPDLVFPALPEIRERWPGLVPVLVPTPSAAVPARLRSGELDLAVSLGAVPAEPALTVRGAGQLTHGVHCGAAHPLFSVPTPTPEEILAHPFVAPSPSVDGRPVDPWPAHRPRRIVVRAEHMQLGVDLCREGELLSVLPDLVGRRAGLRRLPFPALPATPLDVATRRTLALPTPTDRVAEVLVRRFPTDP